MAKEATVKAEELKKDLSTVAAAIDEGQEIYSPETYRCLLITCHAMERDRDIVQMRYPPSEEDNDSGPDPYQTGVIRPAPKPAPKEHGEYDRDIVQLLYKLPEEVKKGHDEACRKLAKTLEDNHVDTTVPEAVLHLSKNEPELFKALKNVQYALSSLVVAKFRP